MYSSAIVTFVLIFMQAFSYIPNHDMYAPKIKINEWLVRITKGIDVAKTIAEKEGFEIVDEIPELKLFKFLNLNPNEGLQKEEIMIKLEYDEISWKSPVTVATHHTSNFSLWPIMDYFVDLVAKFFDHSHPQNYDEKSLVFSKGAPNFSLPDSNVKIPSVQSQPKLQKYPALLCAGPENIIVKSDKPQFCNDPLYPQQWFLRSCREIVEPKAAYYDIKLLQTWQDFDVYGRGIKILVLDNGVKINHEDLVIDPEYSYNYFTGNHDPSPENLEESHGTLCAGVIGMKKDNGICGVGIAPEAIIGGIKMIKNRRSDSDTMSKALIYKMREVDIVTSSTYNTEQIFEPLEDEIESALAEGVTKGRGGKGILYLIASGNQKNEKKPITCSRIAILNSIYVISVGGVNHDGSVSIYSNRCSNVMTVLYSGDGYPYFIPTVALGGSNVECEEKFMGTSASTPMATGALALVLEANPNLTWRDVYHIIAWTSEVAPLAKNPGWKQNAAGFHVSLDFGFGLMNVYDMVALAKEFKKTTPPMHGCSVNIRTAKNLKIDAYSPVKIKILFSGCRGNPMEVNYTEHVLLNVNMKYFYRGDLQIRLTSPRGTTVEILEPRIYDNVGNSIYNYNFRSIHTWGEDPTGSWILRIFDNSKKSTNRGEIFDLELMVYGTKELPELYNNGKRKYIPFKLEH